MTDSALSLNPGGRLAPEQVVGRDALAARVWRILDRQSVVLSAERRMGKTSLITLMMAEGRLPPHTRCLFRDLEGIDTPLGFVEKIATSVWNLSAKGRAKRGLTKLLRTLGGAEVAGVIKFPQPDQTPWQEILTKLIGELAADPDTRTVFFWDELPLMLYDIQRRGTGRAGEVLDRLRNIRQTHPSVRMVFTGSIGLHHVLRGLKADGYANDPTNDMLAVDVPPLELPHAASLAERLLRGEEIPCDDRAALAERVARHADGVPFHVHHLVHRLADLEPPVTPTILDHAVEALLKDPHDPLHLRHYRERIDTYYGDHRDIVLAILDALAPGPQSTEALFNGVKARQPVDDPEVIRGLLTMLQQDHYLVRTDAGAFAFRLNLVRRHWRWDRSL